MGEQHHEDLDRTARILRRRDREQWSWKQIADKEHISRERVRQIYYRGIHRKEHTDD